MQLLSTRWTSWQPFTTAAQLLGLSQQGPVAIDEILGYFGKRKSVACKKYQAFVAEGADQGQRTELTGGGIIRSIIGAGLVAV